MTETITSRPPSILLEPPPKGVELEDPGAQESAAESDDEHFSDASEGRSPTAPLRIHTSSPQEGDKSYLNLPVSPGGTPVPLTVVEKVDPEDVCYGEQPGTPAFEKRKMDAVPDLVYKVGDWDPESSENVPPRSPAESPIPETKLSRVDSLPERATSPASFTAHKRRMSDALPDKVEVVSDPEGPTGLLESRASSPSELDQNSNPTDGEAGDDFADEGAAPFGDDFDDFKEGEDNVEQDDFGDFDNEFEEAAPDAVVDLDQAQHSSISMEDPSSTTSAPPIDLSAFDSLSELLAATSDHLDTLFPKSTNLSTSSTSIDPIPDSSAIFNTDRSLSLWSQLVAPPPLQPPNWTKSRIRRLFLVSLGVPVDLDEILPASKQKKLVLPSITDLSHNIPTRSGSTRPAKSRDPNNYPTARSSTSTDDARRSRSGNPPSHGAAPPSSSSRHRRGQPAAPALDLSAVRRLCATTDAALDGLTDEEMQQHVQMLEDMTVRAGEVLEYWLKRRDGQVGEKEAYDGVIENLVKHARQVRS